VISKKALNQKAINLFRIQSTNINYLDYLNMLRNFKLTFLIVTCMIFSLCMGLELKSVLVMAMMMMKLSALTCNRQTADGRAKRQIK